MTLFMTARVSLLSSGLELCSVNICLDMLQFCLSPCQLLTANGSATNLFYSEDGNSVKAHPFSRDKTREFS